MSSSSRTAPASTAARTSGAHSHNNNNSSHTVELAHGKKLKCVCTATMVYDVAPYPHDSDIMFEMVLLDIADQVRQTAGNKGWLSRMWNGVKGYAQSQVLAQRQASFVHHFSRQLEMNADESHTVMLSARCAVLSMGVPQCGMVYITNYGLYFCADGVVMIEDTCVEPTANEDPDDISTSSSIESHIVNDALLEGRELIKDRIVLSEIASILPSIVLPTRDNGPPFLQGIPNPIVYPTAVQLFMAGSRSSEQQLFQFIGVSDVVVKPPGVTFPYKSSVSNPETLAPLDEVVKASEVELLASLPSYLSALLLTALLERLWTKRLQRLGLPPLNPSVTYAAPH